MPIDLLPCPFCGGPVTLRPGNVTALVAIVCEEGSPCRGSALFQCCKADQVDDAVARWNTRSAPTYEQGVAAGLEMAAKVADEMAETYACGSVEAAIRALTDQPSPVEEPKP